jgi:hypothetical protein
MSNTKKKYFSLNLRECTIIELKYRRWCLIIFLIEKGKARAQRGLSFIQKYILY